MADKLEALKTRTKQTLRCTVDRSEALRYLGYAGQNVDTVLMDRFENLAKTCETRTLPAYVWQVFEIDHTNTSWLQNQPHVEPCIALKQTPLVLKGIHINHHLYGATHVALLAATLGLNNERDLRAYNAISTVDGMIYSACASSLIEEAADRANAEIEDAAHACGLYTTWRFSPGYGDLPLDIQAEFVRTLQAQKALGLSVTPSNLLVPTKSITAIIGLFPSKPSTTNESPCTICPTRFSCSYQEKGITCHGR